VNFVPIGWMVRTVVGTPEMSTIRTAAFRPALLPTAISATPSKAPGTQVPPEKLPKSAAASLTPPE
jgi:hypothetical protein